MASTTQGLEPAPASPGAPGDLPSLLTGPQAGVSEERMHRPVSLSNWGWRSQVAPGTHTGWEHSCGLQARRMALGFVRASQKPRCTILWSSLRRQPYLVNWEPEDKSLRGLMGQCGPSTGHREAAPWAASAPFPQASNGGGQCARARPWRYPASCPPSTPGSASGRPGESGHLVPWSLNWLPGAGGRALFPLHCSATYSTSN